MLPFLCVQHRVGLGTRLGGTYWYSETDWNNHVQWSRLNFSAIRTLVWLARGWVAIITRLAKEAKRSTVYYTLLISRAQPWTSYFSLFSLTKTRSNLNQHSSGNDRRNNIEHQQLLLKLEGDHRYGSELLQRSLTAASKYICWTNMKLIHKINIILLIPREREWWTKIV